MSEYNNYNPNTPDQDQTLYDPYQAPTPDQFDNAADEATVFVNQSDGFASSYIQQTMPGVIDEAETVLLSQAQPAAPGIVEDADTVLLSDMKPPVADMGQAYEQPAPEAYQPSYEQPAPEAYQPSYNQPAPEPYQQPASNINDQFQQYQQAQNQRSQQINSQFQQYQQNPPYQGYNQNYGYGQGGNYAQNNGYGQGSYQNAQGSYGGTPTYRTPEQGMRSAPFDGGFSTGYGGGADTAWKNQNPQQSGAAGGYQNSAGTRAAGNAGQGGYSYNPNPYGTPAGYQQPYQPVDPKSDPGYTTGLWSMILGIASCVLFWSHITGSIALGCGIAAIVLGIVSGKKALVKRSGMATAGLVCGIIGVSLSIISVACWACACSIGGAMMEDLF